MHSNVRKISEWKNLIRCNKFVSHADELLIIYSMQWHGMANEHNSFTAFQCLTYENLSH